MNTSAHLNRLICGAKIIVVLWVCCAFPGCKSDNAEPAAEVAVANSYLGMAVKDLCGQQYPVCELVPPGMCPGHFDISPAQVSQLCNCKTLFVFDFQKNIEKALPRIKERGLKVCTVTPSPGMCIPETYLAIVKQVAAALSEQHPSQKKHYESRLRDIEQRLKILSQDLADRVKASELQGTKVITSQHQAEFSKWIGLDCVSTFSGRDTLTPVQIDHNLQTAKQRQIKLVVANKQEGTEIAEILAGRLKVRCVVFSNFPENDEQNTAVAGYDRLVNENINRLIEAMP